MEIDTIREKIADALCSPEACAEWNEILEETSPGHYGINDTDVYAEMKDIWVDVPNRTFEFKNTSLSLNLRLMASSDKEGMDENFTKTVSGSGKFDFTPGGSDVVISDFTINNLPIDLYGDE